MVGKMKTCLVVDDSKTTRKIARRLLENLSFDVTEASNGAVAMDMCREKMPEAILLDWNMPVMDGITFLRTLREVEGGKYPVVVFCTTNIDLEHITDALTEGASEYITKPLTPETLAVKFSHIGLIWELAQKSTPFLARMNAAQSGFAHRTPNCRFRKPAGRPKPALSPDLGPATVLQS